MDIVQDFEFKLVISLCCLMMIAWPTAYFLCSFCLLKNVHTTYSNKHYLFMGIVYSNLLMKDCN